MSSIDGPTMGKLCDAMAATIVTVVDDPSAWNLHARRIAEALRLNVIRIGFYPELRSTCFAIVQEASRQDRSVAEVREAVAQWKDGAA